MERDVSKNKRYIEFVRLAQELENTYGISAKKILDFDLLKMPVSLYSSGLSTLEIASVYLIDNIGTSITNAANILGRSKQGIFQSYKSAIKKRGKRKLILKPGKFDIPILLISNSKFSPLESVVVFLHEEKNLGLSRIANLLFRDPRTIWTVYNRSKKK